ncbi:MAG: Co2+/Mg2+ efflux protein ApaG [Gemmatimonadales bacterium]|nr:Co2+/Mg2+ efflux protein ApaG [Gemmatimonadales bacterium]
MAPFYYRMTDGIRISVRPAYLRGQSRPTLGHFVFAYTVRIENVGTVPAQLLSRFWRIHDSVGGGEDHEVRGDGVIGEQPWIAPGAVHTYQSYCILKSPSGYMEGHYEFQREDESTFQAPIPRFDLAAGAQADRR